jgi:hypothetical protein
MAAKRRAEDKSAIGHGQQARTIEINTNNNQFNINLCYLGV